MSVIYDERNTGRLGRNPPHNEGVPRRNPHPFPVAAGGIPQAAGQADDEIGVSGPPWNMPQRTVMPLDRKTDKKFPFRTPVFRRDQIQRGIVQTMLRDQTAQKAPGVALPIRSSLAQVIHVHNWRYAKYFSWIRPFGMAPGYPVAKVSTIINTSPRNRTIYPRPVINRQSGQAPAQARVGSRGNAYAMGSPRRFKKALPVSLTAYSPPTYRR